MIAALQTGARYQELARLKVADFNPDVGTLAIWQSKSGKPRHVVLTDEGVDFFRQITAGRAGTELMLPRADGRQWARSNQQNKMLAACKRAKIEPPISIHGLRHVWASLAVMADMSLMLVAKVSDTPQRGWSKILRPSGAKPLTDEIRKKAPRFDIAKSNVTAIR